MKIERSPNKLQTGARGLNLRCLLLLHTACRPAVATRLNVRLCVAKRRLTWLVLRTNTRVGTALFSRIVQYEAHVDTSNNCPQSKPENSSWAVQLRMERGHIRKFGYDALMIYCCFRT